MGDCLQEAHVGVTDGSLLWSVCIRVCVQALSLQLTGWETDVAAALRATFLSSFAVRILTAFQFAGQPRREFELGAFARLYWGEKGNGKCESS